MLTNLNEHPTNILLALCGGTVLIFEELHHTGARVAIVAKFINAMLECTDNNDDSISQIAIECLSSLSSLYDKLIKLDRVCISF